MLLKRLGKIWFDLVMGSIVVALAMGAVMVLLGGMRQ